MTSRTLAYLPQLDGLRAVAVLLVLLAHGSNTVDVPVLAPFWKGVETLRTGYVGVDLFFALSGFLITRLLIDERRRSGRIDLRRFYLRRTLRIFPIYYLSILVVASTWHTSPGLLASLLLYGFNYYVPFNPVPYPLEHTWSLAVEEQFYLLWPGLVAVLPLAAMRIVTRGVAPAIAVGVAIGFACLFPPALGGELIYTSLPTRMFSLLLGASLAVSEAQGRSVGWRPSLLVMLAGGAILLATVVGRATHVVPAGGVYWCFALVGYGALAVGTLGVVAGPDAPRLIVALLSWAPLRAIGRISYGLYLYHLPVLFYLGIDQAGTNGQGVAASRLLLGYALAFALATGSYLLIERPLLRSREWLTRLFRGKKLEQAEGL